MIGACSTESTLIAVLSNKNFPTAAEFGDEVCRATGDCQLRRFLDVDVTCSSVTQELIGVSQPVGKRCEHLQSDVWVASHKGQKMLARKYSQPRIFRYPCICRARFTVE